MVEQIISAQNIFKTYDIGEVHVRALQDLTIDIERGAMVAIMGPSGCGKTTLLNCLSGIDDINSGTIHIENTDLYQFNYNIKTDYRDRRMGFILSLIHI